MANFSVNQVRHLYVMNKFVAADTAHTAIGDTSVKADAAKNYVYFSYRGADGDVRSDLIDINSIVYAKTNQKDTIAHKNLAYKVTLDSTINGGQPIVGEDYILRLAFSQYVGMSNDDQYFKYGMVHAVSGQTASDFYKVLATSIAKNMSREVTPLVTVKVHSAATASASGFDENGLLEVGPLTKISATDIDYVLIIEAVQPWRRGIMAQTFVDFKAIPTTITYNGEDVIWGVVEKVDAGTIDNGKVMADLEYFCLGERGDIYRGMGWPNNIETHYEVDASVGYYTFDIHYSYSGDGENVQKSEKDVTIICKDKAELKKLTDAFKTATGVTPVEKV